MRFINTLNNNNNNNTCLAACHQHSGDWLFSLPIASCGLKLDDEAVRVAVGLRLGLDLCVPHECHCGFRVDVRGVHSFVCKRAPGRTSRHQAFNDLITRAFSFAGFPVTKEPSGLFRSDGKRLDGLTLVPWSSGKALCWDVTVTCPLADSYISAAARESCAAAEIAARKRSTLILMVIIFLNRSPLTQLAYSTHQLGRKISEHRGSQRNELSVSKMLGARAAFQCHITSRQFTCL